MRHILAKERERRVGHHDIRLLQQLDALITTEIPVSLQRTDANLLGVWYAVGVAVAQILQLDGLLAVVAAEEVGILVLVASGDETFQAQLLEAVGKVVEEVADTGIVAVAEDSLPPEVITVVTKLILDVGQLGVELVFLGLVGGLQVFVSSHAVDSLRA